jgi:hypothetical protein
VDLDQRLDSSEEALRPSEDPQGLNPELELRIASTDLNPSTACLEGSSPEWPRSWDQAEWPSNNTNNTRSSSTNNTRNSSSNISSNTLSSNSSRCEGRAKDLQGPCKEWE